MVAVLESGWHSVAVATVLGSSDNHCHSGKPNSAVFLMITGRVDSYNESTVNQGTGVSVPAGSAVRAAMERGLSRSLVCIYSQKSYAFMPIKKVSV